MKERRPATSLARSHGVPVEWTPFGLALVGLLATAGCVGSGVGLDINGDPIVDAGPTADAGSAGNVLPPDAGLAWLEEVIFTPHCAHCHSGAGAPLGLELSPLQDASELLVNVPSVEAPNLMRIDPGDPADSYLYIKIVGTDPRLVGERMPFGGPYLSDQLIGAVYQWILEGAPK